MSNNFDRQVSIIGTGRVATSLAGALLNHGVKINEIYGRSIEKSQILSQKTSEAWATDSLDFTKSKSHIFIVAISDDAIAKVTKNIILPPNGILAHTSGTASLDVFDQPNSGIFYPLQTFTHDNEVEFSKIPILIDGKTDSVKKDLCRLGQLISSKVQLVSESERQQLHLAAVFASNFTNRMLAAAEELLKNTSLNINILEPLVIKSIENVFDTNPDLALTGPAKRKDHSTIKKQMEALEAYPELQIIYNEITSRIMKEID